MKNKRIKRASPGFRFGSANRVGPGLEVATAFDFERQIGVELPHNRGYSGDKGCTKCFLVAVLDSEVEERIGGEETSFWDKRAVEQGLLIDPLGLPGS